MRIYVNLVRKNETHDPSHNRVSTMIAAVVELPHGTINVSDAEYLYVKEHRQALLNQSPWSTHAGTYMTTGSARDVTLRFSTVRKSQARMTYQLIIRHPCVLS